MKISLNWLKKYVDIDVSVDELCDKMIMSGFEVESIDDLSLTMNNVIAARIEKIEKHPNADKLQICSVSIGNDEPVQIVTGATNIFEGAMVPAALHNSHLPNGMNIKKGKLRGVESHGMLCSGEELCIKESDYKGAEVNGILILQSSCIPGTDMRDILQLNDVVIDFKITANRPDCQSVLGVAREIAVVLRKQLRLPSPEFKTFGGNINDYISIKVEDYDLCPRYLGRVVKNLRIKESPDWLKQCLRTAGMRPINNIVDITNYVMIETGQPMHAFDLRDIKDSKILVRKAKKGEMITTLDDKEHVLNEEMLVIADGKSPSCLAGIMGGQNSEINQDTKDLFLECAKFRRDSVRKTARALGMRTESSARFEKGVDIYNVEFAMNRALQLIHELDAGDIIDEYIDCNDGLPPERVLNVKADSINSILGLEIPAETMADILNSLSISTELKDEMLNCKVPSFRDDIEGRADLAEEVMRIYGYDHIIGTSMRGDIIRGKCLPERRKTDSVKSLLISHGMREISTYSFIGSKSVDTLGLDSDDERRKIISLINPLSDDYSTLRNQLITSMLSVISTNYNRKVSAARFFEVSKLFIPKSLPVKEQPNEIPALALGLYGNDEDFFTLKGIVEDIIGLFGTETEYSPSSEPYLHPGRQAYVKVGNETVAVIGEVHPNTSEIYGIDSRVYVGEVILEKLFKLPENLILYKPLPKFPAVTRDLALICNADTPVGSLKEIITHASGELLERLELFDVYQGSQIPEGKKSVAYSITLRSKQGTLKDEQVDSIIKKIIKKLETAGAALRQ